jgi:hypothetical protein
LHDFGPIRATGIPECRVFEEWLATLFSAVVMVFLACRFGGEIISVDDLFESLLEKLDVAREWELPWFRHCSVGDLKQ